MSNASFLPDDYLVQKAERRTNIISLSLFGVVMVAVVAAFFVTNRQSRLIKNLQESINSQYQQAGKQIQELNELERQKQEMLNKAELAGALVERVPRSILLAELINRMPDRLALLEFDMKSERIKTGATPAIAPASGKGRLSGPAGRAPTKQEAGETVQKVEPPRYKVTISMLGVAPTDLEVSRFMMELNAFEFLRDVTLVFSEQKEIEERSMRQFRINLVLNSSADARRINPLTVPRTKNPMMDDVQFRTTPTVSSSAAAAAKEGH